MNLKTLRNVVFWSFGVLYLILAPLISLHALGFVFEPKAFAFVKTGILSIDSHPKGASVTLNGNLFSDKTPLAISRLRAGKYRVQVNLPDYQTWNRELSVQPEEVTRAEHILLVPQKLKIEIPFSFPIQHLVPSNEGKFLFLISKEEKTVNIYAFDLKKERLFRVMSHTEAKHRKTLLVSLTSSDDDRRLLACFDGRPGPEYVIAALSETAGPISLPLISGKPISNVRFHPRDSQELFYLNAGELARFNLNNQSKKEIILKDVRSFEIIQDKIYYFTNDFRLFSSGLDGRENIDLLPERGLRRLLFGEEEKHVYQMFFTAKENAFWLRQDGTFLMNRLPYFADENVRGAKLAADSERLLYWKSNELWILDLSPVEARRNGFFEEGPAKNLLWQSDRPIVSAEILRGEDHVMAATDKMILIIEATEAPSKNSFVICAHKAGQKISFYFDDDSGKLYWTDRGKDGRATLHISKLFEPIPYPFTIRFRKPYHSPDKIVL